MTSAAIVLAGEGDPVRSGAGAMSFSKAVRGSINRGPSRPMQAFEATNHYFDRAALAST